MWQQLRDELHPQGFELVTVGLDSLGSAGCRTFMEAAQPTHPALLDPQHALAEKFGVINIPSSVWIDEDGMIVRPAEAAPAPPVAKPKDTASALGISEMPPRFVEMMSHAAKIQANPEAYHAALRNWVNKGSDSEFALSPEEVVARSRPRNADQALGHAHFELASALVQADNKAEAVEHFRKAHALVPDSWTFRRQAWSLEPVGDGPASRFWQGPSPENPEAWPYEGGWLEDIKETGAENYSEAWKP